MFLNPRRTRAAPAGLGVLGKCRRRSRALCPAPGLIFPGRLQSVAGGCPLPYGIPDLGLLTGTAIGPGRSRARSASSGQEGAHGLPAWWRVTAVACARWLTMGQPKPPVPPWRSGTRSRGPWGQDS